MRRRKTNQTGGFPSRLRGRRAKGKQYYPRNGRRHGTLIAIRIQVSQSEYYSNCTYNEEPHQLIALLPHVMGLLILRTEESKCDTLDETPRQDNDTEGCHHHPGDQTSTSSGTQFENMIEIQAPSYHQHLNPIGRSELDEGTSQRQYQTGSVPPLDLTKECDRLLTFRLWPNKEIKPELLAKAGFYYRGCDDIVKCAFCGIEGFRWKKGDNPMDDHTQWNRDCPFIQRNRSEQDNTQANPSSNPGRDVCGNLPIEVYPNSVPEDANFAKLEKLGVQRTRQPSYTEHALIENRLKTFISWPKSMRPKPEELASAGFFYLGVGDQTLCFHCGGGLKDWENDDDPWEQHAKWFPNCSYLLFKKGQNFVDEVQNKVNASVKECKVSAETATTSSESRSANAKETLSDDKKSQDGTLCKICYKNELGVVFLPCGHMAACVDCAAALKECCICRKPLQATVRAFIS